MEWYTLDSALYISSSYRHIGKKYGYWKRKRLIKGDILKMEINVGKQEMRYYINDIDQGIAFEGIDFTCDEKKFNMCVYIGDTNVSIELLRYSEIECETRAI